MNQNPRGSVHRFAGRFAFNFDLFTVVVSLLADQALGFLLATFVLYGIFIVLTHLGCLLRGCALFSIWERPERIEGGESIFL